MQETLNNSIAEMPLEKFAASDAKSLLRQLGTDRQKGLEQKEANSRLDVFGANQYERKSLVNPVALFFHQFQSSVVALLLVAAAASAFFKEGLQAAGILIAVFINAITGFYMEFKAGMSLAGLKALAGLSVRAVRGGENIELAVADLVPGDIVILEAGSRVPADIRLLEAHSLTVDESPLTGESVPVFKELVAEEGQLNNILFHGTLVTAGRARGVVIKTGFRSSLGKLGKLLEQTDSGATPLENQLEELGKQLSVMTIAICAVVSVVGIIHHENVLLMVETGIALAVAAIPEGLPVLATLALAVGTQRMVRNRAILRHLAAVETLGCTSVICTDKTGTLTENQMMVCQVYADGRLLNVDGSGYVPKGQINEGESELRAIEDPVFAELLRAGALCCDAKLEHNEEEGWHVHGDPTEGALLALAAKAGFDLNELNASMPRLSEFPFDLSRKRMTTVHGAIAYTKGSPGALIRQCSKLLSASGVQELDDEKIALYTRQNEILAQQGLRVLAVARKELGKQPVCFDLQEIESEMTLIGLIGIKDPVREGVKDAIAACKKAGIKIIMLTGDQALTARAIAEELGIIDDNTNTAENVVITGMQLADLSASEAKASMKSASVLARVTPELKLDIVKNLQEAHGVVSMTGDGVNDAPALKQANIGVAMGRKGTDLARSVSEMIITDDNFATIVKAIEQGRITYINIQRAVCYLLTASLSSVITVALGIMFDVGLPLNPLQLLWLNLIMHIFPGLGIVLQKGDKSVMEMKPRDPGQKLVSAKQQIQICIRSVIVSLTVLCAVHHAGAIGKGGDHVSTFGLCTLSLSLLFQAWSWLHAWGEGDGEHKREKIGFAMIANMIAAYFLLFAAIYIGIIRDILTTVPLNVSELGYCFILSLVSWILSNLVLNLVHRRSPASQSRS